MTTRKTRLFWQIEMTAENMLKQHECYNEPYSGIDFMIASCNIDLIPLKNVTNKNLLGVYGYNGHERIIAYNTQISSERILFTKAHELGHFILKHGLKNDIVTESTIKTKDLQETEANIFAAALLMPKGLVVEVIKQQLGSTHSILSKESIITYIDLCYQEKKMLISAMKNKFNTSRESIEWRLIDITAKKNSN